jgi:hypothetical protein
MFDASQWHDYFVMVGGGAAALTGLVFVAMSLHLSDIVTNPAHRHRARTILTALTDVFVRCGLVLMGGQGARAVGAELFVVAAGVEFVVLRSLYRALRGSGAGAPSAPLRSLVPVALRGGSPRQHGVLFRTLGYAVCLVVEEAGAAILFFRHTAGLYLVGVGMMVSFLFIVSGAWLLLVAVESPVRSPTS